jgi:ABC-type uncharacterized transport system YnjBCD ATPase subunit
VIGADFGVKRLFERSLNLTVDKEEAVRAAKAHGSGDSDLFSTALGFLGQHKVRMISMIVSIDIVHMFLQ